ncbi:MAG: hypothetical protein IJA34_02540 [Lachnospiraceae bacterium]|nr:hypothetical protein [Lachnospiraceae bacterium]
MPTINNLYALSELFQMPIDLMICGNREKIKTNNNFDNQDLHNKRVYAYYEKITEKNVA